MQHRRLFAPSRVSILPLLAILSTSMGCSTAKSGSDTPHKSETPDASPSTDGGPNETNPTDASTNPTTNPTKYTNHDLILLNYGGQGFAGRRLSNGHIYEHWLRFSGPWDDWKIDYDEWMLEARDPHISIVQVNTSDDSDNEPTPPKNYYRMMRFGLCSALLGDAYFAFEDATDRSENEHSWDRYYDEYDIDLGSPSGAGHKLPNGTWVRFFANGASIVNPSASTQTVSDSDLKLLPGYSGPYYRFKGNQDPETNNGSPFDSVTLVSTTASNENSKTYSIGDGIVLLKEPRAVVAEVIVDNCDSATSPGSSAATLLPNESAWIVDALRVNATSRPNPFWFTGPSWFKSYRPGYVWSQASDGNASAEFVPTINQAGTWEVYERHGWRQVVDERINGEAKDVPYTIHHAGGQATGVIDQTTGYGKWNLLGTFKFDKGTSGKVVITNNASGHVIADAFKFVYKDQPITTRPAHGYPRLAIFSLAAGGSFDWYAKFDLIVMRPISNEDAAAIKEINPNTYILPTRDWNSGHIDDEEAVTDEYALVSSDGTPIHYARSFSLKDPTDYCPIVNGQRYNEYYPQWLTDPSRADFRIFDGLANDGMWNSVHLAHETGDVDIDRDGIDDFNVGSGVERVNGIWRTGWETFITNLRARMAEQQKR